MDTVKEKKKEESWFERKGCRGCCEIEVDDRQQPSLYVNVEFETLKNGKR